VQCYVVACMSTVMHGIIVLTKSSDIVINDCVINDYSTKDTKMKHLLLCENLFLSSSTSIMSTIISSTTDKIIGNTSPALLEVYELHEDMELISHGPKVVPKN